MFFNTLNKADHIDRPKFFLDKEVFPQTIDVIKTRALPIGIEVVVGDASTAPLKKPHPQVYLQVLKEMNLRPQACIALEDSHNGLRAALTAGLAAVVTPTGFTGHQDFSGALRVLPHLQGVSVGHLQAWLNERAAATVQ